MVLMQDYHLNIWNAIVQWKELSKKEIDMYIIKLATGRKVELQITIDYSTGETDARVVGNPNGEGCSKEEHAANESFNEKLLQDLLETEIAEFGEMEIVDSGLTSEGFAEKMKKRTKPLPYNPLKNPNAPKNIPGKPQAQPVEQPQLDTGFGV